MDETSWTLPGLQLRDVTVDVPLRHDALGGDGGDDGEVARAARLSVFARIATAPGGEDRPYLVYLQGGPGSEAPRPTAVPSAPSWLARALEDFQVVLPDQRGTGRSTPVGLDTPLPEGAIPGAATLRAASDAQRAAYLTHFRADAIVEDAEVLRRTLGAERWTLLGQSFGGFCTLRYLSAHAGSVDAALFTGGLPALGDAIDDVYRTTWEGMVARSEHHYTRFPEDRDAVRRLVALADAGSLVLPDGSPVTRERVRSLGHLLGASGGPERLHYLLDLDPRSPAFVHDLAVALPFGARNPLYAVVHESCWADGGTTGWAADRTMPEAVREDPTLLAGEHVHRGLFDEDPALAPWKDTAELLAAHDWPRLYDEDALRAADVPAAAAVYYDDAYVPREHSLATAALLPRITCWITSEYEHNGLRASGDGVFEHLLEIVQGTRLA